MVCKLPNDIITGFLYGFSMTAKRHIIHFMLAFCIGILPVLNASAMSVEHSPSLPVDCLDCDLFESGLEKPCEKMDCDSISQSCSSQAGANYLPALSFVEVIPFAQGNDPGRSASDYRQNLTDSIYRPPIA